MQRITCYGLLAVVALVVPISGQRAAQPQQMPRANVRELATIEAEVSEFLRLPSGRAVIYSTRHTDGRDATFTYDIGTKRSTLLGANMEPASVSPSGDRLAVRRSAVDSTGNFLWTMPIDPRTGLATGQAQRVSLRPTLSRPIFSPDGTTLAFQAGPRPDGTGRRDVTLVPATGGVERVVANYAARVWLGWSADGKSLYVERDDDNPRTVIERVPVGGGPSEPLVPRTPITSSFAVGLSPDARVAFFTDNPDSFFYRTTSGSEGEISVALPPLDDAWGFNLTMDSKLRYATMTYVQNQGVHILDVATGKARDLLPGKVPSSAPAWSPDGRRLAVLSGPRSHRDIIVINADGSGPRRYPLPLHVSAVNNPMARPWSPDGRFLAFIVDDGPKVARSAPLLRQIALLDLKSGQTRVLKTSPGDLFSFVWRSDSGAIRTVKRAIGSDGSMSRWSIVEIPMNGTERSLRDITAEFPTVSNATIPSDQNAVVRVGTDRQTEWFLVPLSGGAAKRLNVVTKPGTRTGSGLLAGNELLFAQLDNANGDFQGLTIVSTVGEAQRTLQFPFRGFGGMVFPDGQKMVAVGKPSGDDPTYNLFLVPLDGSPLRQIGKVPRGNGGLMAPSPDGRLIAYASDGPVISKILEIDFAPTLPTIMKR